MYHFPADLIDHIIAFLRGSSSIREVQLIEWSGLNADHIRQLQDVNDYREQYGYPKVDIIWKEF